MAEVTVPEVGTWQERVVGGETRWAVGGKVMGSVSRGTGFLLWVKWGLTGGFSRKGHDLTQILKQLLWLQSWKISFRRARGEQRVCNQCQRWWWWQERWREVARFILKTKLSGFADRSDGMLVREAKEETCLQPLWGWSYRHLERGKLKGKHLWGDSNSLVEGSWGGS